LLIITITNKIDNSTQRNYLYYQTINIWYDFHRL